MRLWIISVYLISVLFTLWLKLLFLAMYECMDILIAY